MNSVCDDLRNRFTYHPPTADQVPRYEAVRAAALLLALQLEQLVPDSPERDRAFDALDEVVWRANAAIARREG